MKEIKEIILSYALANAIKYNGKANSGNIIGKVVGENPELKHKMADLKKGIELAVKEVNAMSIDEQVKLLEEIAPEMLTEKKKEKVKELPPLPGAKDGMVVTRIPPEPSKYNHLGHALSFLINYIYAKKYHGKCILRFEDTNPEKESQEFVDAMIEDCVHYLGITPDKIVFVSDDMGVFYDLAERLIHEGKAYVCFCDREKMQDLRHKGLSCKCREHIHDQCIKEWGYMLKGKYKEGEAVLRLKIDMQAENQVLRDPVIFRVVETPHYRQKDKYKVWPMYDFENSVEDNLCEVTHILRSNEFGTMRTELQNHIKEGLGFKKQIVIEYGRFNIKGGNTQGREITQLVKEGKVTGWDDPRLITLKALKRRGIVKDSFYELVNEVGLSPTQTNLDFGVLAAINRKIIDPQVHRYFFVWNPQVIKIEGAPKQKVELDLHPDNRHGGRLFTTGEEFYVTGDDFGILKNNKLYRLMDCLNFVKKKDKLVFDSLEYEKFKGHGERIMHWLPKDNTVAVEVIIAEGSPVQGVGEERLRELAAGTIVQLERFGFCRVDKTEHNKITFVFGHK